MNAWSEYLRVQALIADRASETMTTTETIKEFADIAASFRHDADVEDTNRPANTNRFAQREPSDRHGLNWRCVSGGDPAAR